MMHVDNSQITPLLENTTAGVVADASKVDPAILALQVAINTNDDEFTAFKTALELPIPDQSIVTRHLRNLAVTNPKLAPLAVTADKIADGSITLAKLADLVITAAKIANGTITEQKYADGSVSRRAIAPGAVGSGQIDGSLLLAFPDASVRAEFDKRGVNIEKYTNLVVANDWKPAIEAACAYGNDVIIPSGVHRIATSFTIPEGVTLRFLPGAKFYIASETILTINASIDAGYYTIFQFENSTSQVYTQNIGVWDESATPTIVHFNIKVDWFGAVPNAAPPVGDNGGSNLPTGVDSSDGFRRAFKFAQQASVKGTPYFIKRPKVTVETSPNSAYYVRGNNLMGLQDDSVRAVFIDFEGNGTQIFHEVLQTTDVLIDNAYKMYSPRYRNFDVDVFTQTGSSRIGKFFDLKGSGKPRIEFVTAIFQNIRIGCGYMPRGYDTIFNIDGSSMADNGTVENCYFGGFSKLFNCVNPEAVNWRFQKNYIHPTTENAVIFNFPGLFSGSFVARDNEMLIAFNGEKILKTVGNVDSGGIFVIEGRCELRVTADTSLFDLDYGTVNVKGFNFFAAAGSGTQPAGFRNARIGKLACIKFEDCFLTSVDFDIGPMDQSISSGQPNNMLVLVNCVLSGGSHDGYPRLNYKLLNNSTLTTKQTITAGYRIRRVIVENPNGNATSFIPHSFESSYGSTRKFQITRTTNNKSTVQGAIVRLPFYCVIQSIKVYIESQNTAIVNKLNINFKLINGFVTDASFTYNLPGTAQYGTELLNNQMIFVDDAVILLDFDFTKDSVAVTDVNSPKSYIEIEYRGLYSLNDFAGYTSGSGRISLI